MNSTIATVFKIVGVLVIVFLFWQLTWNEGGILPTAYNAVASRINIVYQSSRGVDSKLLPLYGDSGSLNVIDAGSFDLSVGS